MSILTQNVKQLCVENVLNLLELFVRVDCILYRRCVLEFTSRLWERKNRQPL